MIRMTDMKNIAKASHAKNEKGVALVTTILLSLLLSILVGGMLLASTSDTLIGSNDVRNNQAFYIAEAGINRSAAWFSSKFASTPSADYVLPERYLYPLNTTIGGVNYSWTGSNTTGEAGKVSYTTGEGSPVKSALTEASPYSTAG